MLSRPSHHSNIYLVYLTMLEAKSIYLGGDIVSAQECNYESYLKLGLKCPFCNSAVFLRAASNRAIKGVQKPITAYFAHFPSGTNDDWDCIARAKSIAGRQEIEEIKIEAKKQRLKIYNNKLWELMTTDLQLTSQKMKEIRKLIGEREIENKTKVVRKEIVNNLNKLCLAIDRISTSLSNKDAGFIKAMSQSPEDAKEMISMSSEYLGQCDRRLHTAICCEVLQFLSTKSGNWVLNKLVALAINACRVELQRPDNKLMPVDGLGSYQFAMIVTYSLVKTHWAEAIAKLDKQAILKC